MAPFTPIDSEVRDALRNTKKNGKINIAAAARLLNIKRPTLANRLLGRKTILERSGSGHLLHDFEEDAICQYAIRMDRIGIRCRATAIRSCANDILAARFKNNNICEISPTEPLTVGESWPHRFLARHLEISVEPEHPIEYLHAQAEDSDYLAA